MSVELELAATLRLGAGLGGRINEVQSSEDALPLVPISDVLSMRDVATNESVLSAMIETSEPSIWSKVPVVTKAFMRLDRHYNKALSRQRLVGPRMAWAWTEADALHYLWAYFVRLTHRGGHSHIFIVAKLKERYLELHSQQTNVPPAPLANAVHNPHPMLALSDYPVDESEPEPEEAAMTVLVDAPLPDYPEDRLTEADLSPEFPPPQALPSFLNNVELVGGDRDDLEPARRKKQNKKRKRGHTQRQTMAWTEGLFKRSSNE